MPPNYEKCNELLKYSQAGDLEKVTELLNRDDVEVNYIARATRTTILNDYAIVHAAAGGHEKVVRLLLEKGADANCHTSYYESPLHQAIDNGHTQAAITLIRHGNIKFRFCTASRITLPIAEATKKGFFDVVVELLRTGVITSDCFNEQWYSPGINRIVFGHGDTSVVNEAISICGSNWVENFWTRSHVYAYSKPEIVSMFLNAGGSFNHRSDSYTTHKISRDNDADTLSVRKIFLERVWDLTWNDVSWIFPEKGMYNFHKFLENNGDINTPGELGITRLMFAVQTCSTATVDRMIKAGADINASNAFGDTALTMAVKVGKAEVVELLTSTNNHDLLLDAIENNDAAAVSEFVFLRMVDLNHADQHGKTALMTACKKGYLHIAKIILENTMGHYDPFGTDVKHTYQAPPEMCADIDAKDSKGNTALALACADGNDAAIELLVNSGADINAKNNVGNSVLALACAVGNNAAVNFLVDSGADINARNNVGNSVLAVCCNSKNLTAAKIILSKKANINVQNEEGNTPLMLACIDKNKPMIKLLLSRKQEKLIKFSHPGKHSYENILDIDIQNNSGKTALMLSYMGDRDQEIVDLLLSAEPEDTGPFDEHGMKIPGSMSSSNCETDQQQDHYSTEAKKQKVQSNDDNQEDWQVVHFTSFQNAYEQEVRELAAAWSKFNVPPTPQPAAHDDFDETPYVSFLANVDLQ